MLKYLKTNAFMVLTIVIVVLFFVSLSLFLLLKDKQRDLDTANEVIRAQSRVLEAQDRIMSFDREIATVANEAIEEIEEIPNAENPISPDVAIAWHDAIVCLRENACGIAVRDAKLSVIDAGNPAGRKPDRGGFDKLLNTAGRSAAKMQC